MLCCCPNILLYRGRRAELNSDRGNTTNVFTLFLAHGVACLLVGIVSLYYRLQSLTMRLGGRIWYPDLVLSLGVESRCWVLVLRAWCWELDTEPWCGEWLLTAIHCSLNRGTIFSSQRWKIWIEIGRSSCVGRKIEAGIYWLALLW